MHIENTLKERIISNLANIDRDTFWQLARDFEVPEQVVIESLPESLTTRVGPAHFEEIMVMVASWGEVWISVRNEAVTFDIKAMLPLGVLQQSTYIFVDDPLYILGGAINTEQLGAIYFIEYDNQELEPERSIHFYDCHGQAMFNIYLLTSIENPKAAEQAEYFETLKNRICGPHGCSCCS
ncbi:MAG: hypothetical protein CSA26_04640 [Desulfobacterales bacterium]|nr:MAG: hypothetical protein CSA26_04640 [Desulfobacterales bacterium]